ncbi:partner and localizer of BRCA2 [Takifugu flavidus]|uniref:Partner and localizer of BRCA2 n=1 Tax=Takifugu flavidus TaxID=433684 RepID=A0A5C6MZM3_9TELE|nr:partner and localizer of BRCA2 [Takifugu flavidus]TWW58907.1 Partner and localizer of BRCA2 [Takifugu flavidus]
MDDTVTDILQCEEQLRTTLHCEDKDKLRRKLLYLQREYHRTAQRLQRAERSEAVQRCVRSRITQQCNHKNQEGREATDNPPDDPSVLISTTTPAQDAQWNGHAGDFEKLRSRVVGFLPPLDAACPQTPISIHESTTDERPSPSLRLRSRRSRMRWERQSSLVGVSTDGSQNGQEPNERMEAAATQTTKGDKTKPTEVFKESEELFSGEESPSLLHTHSSAVGQNEERDVEGKVIQVGPEQTDKEIKLSIEAQQETQPLLLACKSALRREESEQEGKQTERKKVGLEQSEDGQRDGCLQRGARNVDMVVEDGKECEKGVKEDKINIDQGDSVTKGVGLLESCTLVEGLLFPAEYYVRTTRRMTSSQSQPDMQAVILSQLNIGRHRRRRGNGRRLAHSGGSNSQTSDSVGPCSKSKEADMSDETNRQSSSENSGRVPDGQIKTDACFSAADSTSRPARGQKRRRGRGRGRPHTPRCSFSPVTRPQGLEHTSDNPQLTNSPVLLSPSPYRTTVLPCPLPCSADESKSFLTGPVPDDKQHLITPSSASEHVAGMTGTKNSPASGQNRRNRSSQLSGSQESCHSFTMPSPPAATALPLPSLSLGSLLKDLIKFDVQQDFHLPDDQFASLKLHKLHQVAVETGVEHFSSPSYCTRRSVRQFVLNHSGGDAITPLPVPCGSTPTLPSSPDTNKASPFSTPSVGVQNALMAPDTTQGFDQEKTEGSQTESWGLAASPESVSAMGGRAADRVDQCQEQDAELTHRPGKFHPEETQGFTNLTDDGALPKTPSFSCQSERTVKEPPDTKETNKCCDPHTSPCMDNKNQSSSLRSQLLLSPLLASTLSTTAHLHSSILSSSPTLPSLGVTPQTEADALPFASSPSAPNLIPPPPHSPSTQALPPPPLSPRPYIPPSQPPTCIASQVQASSRPVHLAEPANETHGSNIQSEGPEGNRGFKTEAEDEDFKSCTQTLKSPSGGCLVDACCLPGSLGHLHVAAAGKWAVCLWTQTSDSDWSLVHTWSFNEMVINIFPVADAAGLICVTLGQLEIREVRVLSCSSLSQVSLCDGLVQTVAALSKSRVVTSTHSASGSALRVFTLSESGSTSSSQPLVSPGICVGALSPVHGLPDALIGTDDSERLFIWNLDTGQLLQKVLLGDGFSHVACLRGYSYSGVLFVLLQHQFLSSHQEGGGEVPVKKRTNMGLLSLVAVNPLSGKSVLATRLYPPSTWSSRLSDVDVDDRSVVGLSQNGCVCVWELGRRGVPRTVRAPESEGWQLARWGGGGTLLTGHHNGDVTLHCCRKNLIGVQTL